MNPGILEVSWGLRRWAVAAGLIFLGQLFLIYFLAAGHRHFASPPPPRASFQFAGEPLSESQFSETFLLSDPTLFALPNRHGFSGPAWLNAPPRQYDLAEQTESPFWLPLNSEQLGNVISRFVLTNALSSLPISETPPPKILTSPIFDFTSNAKSNSTLRLEGELAARRLLNVPLLRWWATNEILSNSVAQIAVDKKGSVILARLISRSGFSEADRSALEIARLLQFTPGVNEMVWGNLIFDWHTVPIAATNNTTKTNAP